MANNRLALKHAMQTSSSEKDSKASLSLEAVKNKLDKHQSDKMSFDGETDDTIFWNMNIFFHSCFLNMY